MWSFARCFGATPLRKNWKTKKLNKGKTKTTNEKNETKIGTIFVTSDNNQSWQDNTVLRAVLVPVWGNGGAFTYVVPSFWGGDTIPKPPSTHHGERRSLYTSCTLLLRRWYNNPNRSARGTSKDYSPNSPKEIHYEKWKKQNTEKRKTHLSFHAEKSWLDRPPHKQVRTRTDVRPKSTL